MNGKTFLWIEDRKDKASYMFWKTFMQQLFPYVIVESKTNNSELVKAVKSLQDYNNRYIVLLDNSFDNLQVYHEYKSIQSETFDYKTIQEIIKYDNHLDNHNIEQLSAKLLFDLTRNTGFEVSKGMIGKCWIDSCCN